MTLIKLKDYIEQNVEINSEGIFKKKDVMGMTVNKKIIPTKADVKEKELKKFIIVNPNDFIYNPRTHGKKIGLGYNDTNNRFIISWNNIAFHIKKEKLNELKPEFLFMFFNREQWDDMACFDSWGSSTEVFSWDSLCNMEMFLPDLKTQEKYVSVYKSMLNILKIYQTNLEDLKLVCDGYIENLKKKYELKEIGQYLIRLDEKNTNNKIKNVKGVSTLKEFREPTSKVNKEELRNYKVVHPGEISFVQTTHNEKVFAYALNNTQEDIVVTSVNEVFKTNEEVLLPEFLAMFFNRKEFDRYARFHSWGSARETFTWNDLAKVKIPIPNIYIQKEIVNIYVAYKQRKDIVEKLKQKINEICPILIAGAIKEARENE